MQGDGRALALVAIAATAAAAWGVGASAISMDDMYLMLYPQRVLEGAVASRDFYSEYGPANTWLLAGLFWLTGPSVVVMRLVVLAYHVAVATGVFALARPHGRRPATIAGTTSALLMSAIGASAYGWLAAMAALLWSLAILGRPGARPRAAIGAGLLAGLAVSWRPELGAVVLLASWPLLRWGGQTRRWAVGIVAGALPLLIQLGLAPMGTLRDFLLVREGLSSTVLPLPPEHLGTAALFFIVVGAAGLLLVVGFVVIRTPLARSMGTLGPFLLVQLFQRADPVHAIFVGCAVIPLAAVAGLSASRRAPLRIQGALRGAGVGISGALLGLLVLLVVSASFARPAIVTVRHQGRSLPVAATNAAEIKGVLAAVNRAARPGERLFAGVSDLRTGVPNLAMFLYFLLPELEISAYYMAGVRPSPSKLVADARGADVVVLLDADPQRLATLVRGGGDVAASRHLQALEGGLCPADTVGRFRILRRC